MGLVAVKSAVNTARSVVIPTSQGVPDYTMRCRLDGLDYNLRFLWNERMERWGLSIFRDDQVLLVGGLFLVCNWRLLRFYQYNLDVPPGELIAVDLSGDQAPPGLYDMGQDFRVQLTYYPVTDK